MKTQMTAFVVSLCAALACGLVAGCGAQAGSTVMTQGARSAPVMGTAPETGRYALYTAFSANPTKVVDLREGDPLGFRKTADGRIEAVAGDQTNVLSGATAQAYWKL